MKINLGTRYAVIISGGMLIMVAVLAVLYLNQFRATSERQRELSSLTLRENLVAQIRHRGEAVSSVLAERLVNPLYRLDMLRIFQLISEANALPDVDYVFLLGKDGRIIHDGTRHVSAYGLDLDQLAATGAGPAYSPENALEVKTSVVLAGEQLGSVYLGMSLMLVVEQTAAIETALEQAFVEHEQLAVRALALYSLLALLIGVALALTISRGFARPIRKLAQFAVQVGHGRYDQPPHVDRSDEIGLLATSLHEMSDNLQASIGEAEFLAYHDSLTRLPNRAELKRVLSKAVALSDQTQEPIAVLFIDLDDFKKVNDSLGHEAGDEFLQGLAQRLSQWLADRSGEADLSNPLRQAFLARLGGDEFTIILRHIESVESVEAVARELVQLIEQPLIIKGQSVSVGSSIGITLCPEHSSDMSELLRNADIAMYLAKRQGRNNYCTYQHAMSVNG